jgi:hypothetical protein
LFGELVIISIICLLLFACLDYLLICLTICVFNSGASGKRNFFEKAGQGADEKASEIKSNRNAELLGVSRFNMQSKVLSFLDCVFLKSFYLQWRYQQEDVL